MGLGKIFKKVTNVVKKVVSNPLVGATVGTLLAPGIGTALGGGISGGIGSALLGMAPGLLGGLVSPKVESSGNSSGNPDPVSIPPTASGTDLFRASLMKQLVDPRRTEELLRQGISPTAMTSPTSSLIPNRVEQTNSLGQALLTGGNPQTAYAGQIPDLYKAFAPGMAMLPPTNPQQTFPAPQQTPDNWQDIHRTLMTQYLQGLGSSGVH